MIFSNYIEIGSMNNNNNNCDVNAIIMFAAALRAHTSLVNVSCESAQSNIMLGHISNKLYVIAVLCALCSFEKRNRLVNVCC